MVNYKLNENSSLFLDLLRAFTAQLVVIGHGISYFSVFTFFQPPASPYIQNIAVLIFFILSGFLISYSVSNNIQKDPAYSFRSFFIDRFSRIYSAYLPAIIVIAAIDLISICLSDHSYTYYNAYNFKTVLGNLFMLQDFPIFSISKKLNINFIEPITSFGSARPFWTLAIEWWIYLWVGYFVFKIIKKEKISLLNILLLSFLSIVPVFNLISGRGNGLTVYWLFGAIVYYLSGRFQNYAIQKCIRWGLVVFLLFTATIRVLLTMKEYEPILAFLLAIALLISISLAYDTEGLKKYSKIIRFTANYSFTLYLIHYSILDLLSSNYKGTANPYLLFCIGFLISNIIAAVLGYYTEIKLTKLVKSKLKNYYSTPQLP